MQINEINTGLTESVVKDTTSVDYRRPTVVEDFVPARSWGEDTPRRIDACSTDTLTPYTMDELNARIDESEAQIVLGDVLAAEESLHLIEQKIAAWK